MTSKFSIDNRELLQRISSGEAVAGIDFGNLIVRELAAFRLAAMGSRPHTDDELSNLLWYSQEATCHSDPNYSCEFQRLATPGLIAGIIRELQERRKADSEPVAEVLSNRPGNDTSTIDRSLPVGTQLYRHAQQPVVPDDVLDALQKVARIRLDLNDFDGDRRGIADCLCDAEEALIEVVNRRAAMLAAAPQLTGSELATVPGKWIPVSEQKPDCWCLTCRPVVLNDMRFVVCPDCGNKRCPRANDHRNACTGSNEPGQEGGAYPDTPQEVKP